MLLADRVAIITGGAKGIGVELNEPAIAELMTPGKSPTMISQ